MRLSANQNAKLQQQLQAYESQVDNNHEENEILKKKMQKLFQENSGLAEEMRNIQENVRLSNTQQSKAFQQLQEYERRFEENNLENENTKRKVQNLLKENNSLGEEVRSAQENLRLSSNQIAKLNGELNDYRVRI